MSTIKKNVRRNKNAISLQSPIQRKIPLVTYSPGRFVQYFGIVNYATTERVLEEIHQLTVQDPYEDIVMTVTSAGGPTGTAMSFYDHIQYVLKPPLVTIGSGDVDSSGIIIFLSGERRYITKNTTLLLHRAGRVFDGGKRITAAELEAMFREDNLKDFQYASVLSENSSGRLTTEKALELMDNNTILTPAEMVSFGLAHAVIDQ